MESYGHNHCTADTRAMELGATDEQCDFPIVYAIGRQGIDIRSVNLLITVAADMVGTESVNRDNDHVGRGIRSPPSRGGSSQNRKQQPSREAVKQTHSAYFCKATLFSEDSKISLSTCPLICSGCPMP